jgi:hypothetical protein
LHLGSKEYPVPFPARRVDRSVVAQCICPLLPLSICPQLWFCGRVTQWQGLMLFWFSQTHRTESYSCITEGFCKTGEYSDIISTQKQLCSSTSRSYLVSGSILGRRLVHHVPVICASFFLRLLVFGFLLKFFFLKVLLTLEEDMSFFRKVLNELEKHFKNYIVNEEVSFPFT